MQNQNFISKLKYVILNSILLLIPSFIFIVVKVNTVKKTVQWRLENIVIFFFLYSILLSIFVFKLHTVLFRSVLVKSSIRATRVVGHYITEKRAVQGAIVVLFIFLPWLVSLYQIKIFITVLLYLIFAMGLNYTVGFAGILNLGHVLPFAAGAYTYGILYKYFSFAFFPGLLAGSVVGFVMGMLISLITIRLKGDYLAIVTLALAEIFKLLMNNLDTFTGGARGIPGLQLPTLFGYAVGFKQRYIILYYIAFIVMLLGMMLVSRLVKSWQGRSWEAAREDYIAAESMGVNLKAIRMVVFSLGGLYAGIAGVIQASSSTYVSPAIAALLNSITVLSIVVLGGMGSTRGVILGTIIVVMLPEYLRSFALYRMLIYGALLVLMMRYRQMGLIPQKRIYYKKVEDHKNVLQDKGMK